MLYKQKILAGEMLKISKVGRQIKVLNCTSELNIRVYNNGQDLLNTEVRSGFEVHFPRFEYIDIFSDVEQDIEIWASENPLGYDAPTKGSNSNLSSIINHYGDSQQVLPFERNRVAVTLFSDSEPFWYGGEGVTPENGIPVPAGERRRIEGAGELHLAVVKPARYAMSSAAPTKIGSGNYGYSLIEKIGSAFYASTSSGGFGGSRSFYIKDGLIMPITAAGTNGGYDAFVDVDGRVAANHPDGYIDFYSGSVRGERVTHGVLAVSSIAYKDGVFYFARSSSGGIVTVVRKSDLTLQNHDNHILSGMPPGKIKFIDNQLCVFTNAGTYLGVPMVALFSDAILGLVVAPISMGSGVITFNDDYICVSNLGLINRLTAEVEILGGNETAACVTRLGIIKLSNTDIYIKDAGGWLKFGAIGQQIVANEAVLIVAESKLIVTSSYLPQADSLAYDLIKSTVQPLAKIRMLKELV